MDLSADFRLKDPASFERFYGPPPAAFARRNEFVYGLPELFREQIASSRAVASPGCFATASILGPRAALEEGPRRGRRRRSRSSRSRAPRAPGVTPTPTTHHPRRASAFFAYQIDGHRHLPEIEESLSAIGAPAAGRIDLPDPLGAAGARDLRDGDRAAFAGRWTRRRLKDLYREAYGNEFFVRLVDGSPDVAAVKGTNFADIGVAVARATCAKVFVAIDNLVKGAAGQAIQAMNIMFGLPEPTGLKMTGVFP